MKSEQAGLAAASGLGWILWEYAGSEICRHRQASGLQAAAARHWRAGLVAAASLLLASGAAADPLPTAFTYQGQLKLDGELVDDACDCQFSLWDGPDGGTQVGPTLTFDGQGGNPPPIAVTDGLLTVELDFGAGAFDGNARWLEIAVACPSGETLETLSPRQPLTPVPYALYALDAAGGPWQISNNDIYFDGAHVGIGTSEPAFRLDVRSPAPRAIFGWVTNPTGVTYGVFGQSASTAGTGVLGHATASSGNTTGVLGFAGSPTGKGVYGFALDSSGQNYGVYGQTNSSSGYAGYFLGRGHFSGDLGVGLAEPAAPLHVRKAPGDTRPTMTVETLMTGQPASMRIEFDANAIDAFAGERAPTTLNLNKDGGDVTLARSGAGNVGIGTPSPAHPLHIETGTGVNALLASNTSGALAAAGVRGESDSTTGIGAVGLATATGGTNYGVWGQTDSPDGYAGYFAGPPGSRNYFQRDVGIGVSTPESLLHVKGEAGFFEGVIFGQTTNDDSFNFAVYGLNDNPNGTGVRGFAGRTGVWGGTNGIGGYGVYGIALASSSVSRGVYGHAARETGVNYGVYGRTESPDGYSFYAVGPGVKYGQASSIRWKRNIEPIDQPLEKLARLRGVYFDWDSEHGGHRDIGMIGEEVGKVLPQIVNYEANSTDASGMDYGKLTPLLVEATNELRSLVEKKDAEIARQQAVIEALSARLERIEKMLANEDSP